MCAIVADRLKMDRQSTWLCVMYVTESELKECFLALTELNSFDAQSISSELQRQLQINELA